MNSFENLSPQARFWMTVHMLEANGEFEEALEAVNDALEKPDYGGAPYTDVLEIKVRLLLERLEQKTEAFDIVANHLNVPKFAEISQTHEYQQWQRDKRGF
jgi:uncharacterized protein (DUF433 family)